MKDNKYPKIDAKHFHYYNDGSGRDQYVRHNNGGLLSHNMLKSLELSPRIEHTPMVFPRTTTNSRSRGLLPPQHQRIQHYYGDGKGRDYFVTINDGGQVMLSNAHPDEAFPAQLRKYHKQYSSPDHISYLKPNNIKLQQFSQTIRQRQKEFTQSISSPKKQSMPQLQTFMPDLQTQGKYQTYQQLKYQSKACGF